MSSSPSPSFAAGETVVVSFDSQRIARGLASLALLLIAVGVGTSLAYETLDRPHDWWLGFVDVNGEGNLPAWFSVLLLAGTALLLLVVARVRRTQGLGAEREWRLLAWFVVAMSLDEMSSLHELVGGRLDDTISLPMMSGYAWIVPGTVAACAGAFLIARVLRSVPGDTQFAIVTAGVVFLTGALGLEAVEAILTNRTGTFGTSTMLVTGAQELCEMLGLVLLIRTLLRELPRLGASAVVSREDLAGVRSA